jgi:hypothetical protein
MSTPPPPAPEATPPAGPPVPPVQPPAAPSVPPVPPATGEPDWKAHAKEWEKRARENSKAAADLAELKKQSMTDQEKAVEAAKAEGRTAAATEYGARLAAAEFRAAVAAAGLDLGEASDLIDKSQFVTDTGDVDDTAIKAAVAKLAKLAPARGPGRSGGDFGGGPGGAPDIDQQIAAAEKARDFRTVIALKRQKAAQT